MTYSKTTESGITAIADVITDLFEKGITLSTDTVHFLESTYGISRPGQLSNALSTNFDSETETLFQMILFPDEAWQIALEPVIEKNRENAPEEVSNLVSLLEQRSAETTVYFPGETLHCRVIIPKQALSYFVRRLRISRRIDHRILAEIDHRLGDTHAARALKTALRNTRFGFEEHRVSAICAFVAKMPREALDCMPVFMLFCRVIDLMEPNEDLYNTLAREKRRYAERIRQAQKTEKEMKKRPMEAMMMSRAVVASVNMEEVLKNMGYIDLVTMSVFGKRPDVETGHGNHAPNIELGVFKNTGQDVSRVIKILS